MLKYKHFFLLYKLTAFPFLFYKSNFVFKVWVLPNMGLSYPGLLISFRASTVCVFLNIGWFSVFNSRAFILALVSSVCL